MGPSSGAVLEQSGRGSNEGPSEGTNQPCCRGVREGMVVVYILILRVLYSGPP